MSSRITLQFAEGTVIDRRYVIVSHLGDGGMGVVYLAWHKRLKRHVAIKFIPLIAKARGMNAEELFEREAEVQAKLKHENIVEAIDAGVFERADSSNSEPIGYLVMEYIDGSSLRQLINAKQVGRAHALAYLTHVTEALTVLHSASLMHRDLKPENVLVTKQGVAKLTDMGLARVRQKSKYITNNPRPMGTLHYMPFEQLMNTGMDESVDIFSLGVMAFELLVGRHPRAQSPGRLPRKDEVLEPLLLKEAMPRLRDSAPDLPRYLTDVIDAAMSHDPEARPKAQEVGAACRRHVAEIVALAKSEAESSSKVTKRGTVRMQPARQLAAAPAQGNVVTAPVDAQLLTTKAIPFSDPPSSRPASERPAPRAIPPQPRAGLPALLIQDVRRPAASHAAVPRRAGPYGALPRWVPPLALIATFVFTAAILGLLGWRLGIVRARPSAPVPPSTSSPATSR